MKKEKIELFDIQPFIFNWKGQFEKTCIIEESLKSIFGDVIVINSDDNNTKPEWIDLGDDAYFTAQFTKALELFEADKKVLLHIQGDTQYEKWDVLVEDSIKYFEKYNWGIYAPDISNVWYTSENTDIFGKKFEDENLKLVACTDETVWFIHRDIIEDFYTRKLNHYMTPENNKMGWGWDLVMNSISFLMTRPVIRDYNHTIDHKKGTDYNKSLADIEMQKLYQNVPLDIRECISYIKGNRQNILKYFNMSEIKNMAKNKLNNFPHVYYINLDDDVQRKVSTEEQFDSYGVKYTRISGFDGRKSNLFEHLSGRYPQQMNSKEVGASLSHLKAIKTWLETSDTEYAVVCEDDIVFEPVDYWPFDWDTIFKNLPYDWEIFQMAIINDIQISVNLHHRYINDFSAAAYLIKRSYAERLLSYHVVGEKYKLDNGVKPRAVADDLIYNAGRAYAMPLFTYNVNVDSTIHQDHVATFHLNCYNVVTNFWKNEGRYIKDWKQLFDYNPLFGRLPAMPQQSNS